MIYLDYSATTPVNDEVLNSFVKASKYIGNPNSLHKLGVEAKELIDASTNQISNILGVSSSSIIYTSGASESNNTAIKGICSRYCNRGKHIITTELEHSSIVEPLKSLERKGFTISYVKLLENGMVDLFDLEKLMTDDTILVTIASVNSEIGIRQPIEEISKIVHKNQKCYFHVDMTQSIGKEKISFDGVDLASFSAHKFFGIKGIGVLYKKESIIIDNLIEGGKSTTSFRSGTPATALIASMAKALRIAYTDFDNKVSTVKRLNNRLIEGLVNISNVHINSNNNTIPHIVNISVLGVKPETMLHALEQHNIYISTKTACSANENKSSSVYALTNNEEYASTSIRISISHITTEEEIGEFLRVFNIENNHLRLNIGG